MKVHRPDYILLGTVITLVIFGLVMLSSASIVTSLDNFNQPYFYLKHQIIYGLLIGCLFAFIAFKVHYKFWKKFAFPILLITIILLALVFLPGAGSKFGKAARWISLGPVSFQPSEIAKLGFIIYLAAWLEKKSKKIDSLSEGLIPFLIATGLIAGLIILQPNISTMGVIALTAAIVYFAAGAKIWQMILILFLGVGAFFAFTKVFPHAFQRFQVFLHPEIDPQGIGYQINQALLAIGSGGVFGRGFGQSLQKYNYLPESISDSIFAIIAEELGFVGAALLIVLFLIFAFRGLMIAKNAPDNLAKLLAVGITSWLTVQAFINIGAISGLIPLTGIPLPFISYGGSSLVVSLVGVGILLNISKYTLKT